MNNQVHGTKSHSLTIASSTAFWSFMWFVGFCLLANQWQVSKEEDNPLKEGADAARASITFAFFSIFTWAAQAFLGFQRYKLGADSAIFSQDYADPSQDPAATPPAGTEYTAEVGTQPNADSSYDGSGGYQSQDY
ncbi:hypothetical protein ACEWY4_003811 [Coilia grayii]|uniref:MARVEL domain-containing protein n=1 Tax=Coilia grayii TaxID=363190 RepID=A0ABD1KSC1_9TELE